MHKRKLIHKENFTFIANESEFTKHNNTLQTLNTNEILIHKKYLTNTYHKWTSFLNDVIKGKVHNHLVLLKQSI